MKIVSLIALMIMTCVITASAQVIWIEDFSTQANGTQNDPGRWTTTAGNCDADGAPAASSGNFWGVNSATQEFRCNDIEGLTCCSGGSGGQGNNDNIWITAPINIFGYANISISMAARIDADAAECAACNSGGDYFLGQYRIDGGAWNTFMNYCGAVSNFSTVDCLDIGAGTTLEIRVVVGNQANTENYYWDDVMVSADACPPLPVELKHFALNCVDGNVEANWTTSSEINNHYFVIQGSNDAIHYTEIVRVEGNGNSNIEQHYGITFNNQLRNKYFRLQQFDYNGQSKTYSTVYMDCERETPSIEAFISENYLYITMPESLGTHSIVELYDLSGKLHYVNNTNGISNGEMMMIPIGTGLSSGVYLIKLSDPDKSNAYYSKVFVS